MNYAVLVLALVAPSVLARPSVLPSKYTRTMFRMDQAPYIIGGEDADVNEWPWQGYLESFGSFSCGLTVLTDEWVLTAAHCIFGSSPSSITVGVGCTTRSDGCQEFDVDDVIEHPDFAFVPADGDDVGVMHLSTPLTFDDTVQPVVLSTETDISGWAGNSDCWITGWGATQGGGSLPDTMQEANIQVYTIEECEAVWGASQIEDSEHVCVGIAGTSGSCNGDSGGPAVCNDGSGYVQIGITSWGAGGCSTDFPSVYTNLAFFLPWISENCGGCI